MLSYWEQQSFLHYDIIIVGAGIVGLNTAIECKERYPGRRVLVLERGAFPYGASTRNAGFACMGCLTELLDDLEHMSEQEMIDLFARRKKGLEYLRSRLGDSAIGYRANGSHELIAEKELPVLAQMERINALLLDTTGVPAFRLANDKLDALKFPKDKVSALVESTCEGELHTGKMMRSLTDYALMKGIEIRTGAMVSGFNEEAKTVRVTITDAVRAESMELSCDTLFICTNAFTPTLLPDIDLVPGRGQVILTEPIEDLPIKGIFHFDKGYYYFREIDNRILFGGGRLLDFEGETTTAIELHEEIQADLEEKLQQLILPGRKVKIDMRWSGIMAFGSNKRPIVQAFGSRVFGAFRMGGMGVALGTAVAKELVTLAG